MRRVTESRQARRRAALKETFRKIYGVCPACGGDLSEHPRFALASSRPHDPTTRHSSLETAIEQREWARAVEIQEFRGSEDAITYELFNCRSSSRTVLLKLVSYVELWRDDMVLERQILDAAEAEQLESAVRLSWRPLIQESESPSPGA